MSSSASPLVLPQIPRGKKLILKNLTQPSSCFGWLVSLMCCQITSPVTGAIIWNTSTVTGHRIFKGRVTPCGHTNVCTAPEKVLRTPQWNRSWNSESCEVLFEWEDSYLSESTQSIKAHSPACFLLLNSLKILKQHHPKPKKNSSTGHVVVMLLLEFLHPKFLPLGLSAPAQESLMGLQIPGEIWFKSSLCSAVDLSSAARTRLAFKHKRVLAVFLKDNINENTKTKKNQVIWRKQNEGLCRKKPSAPLRNNKYWDVCVCKRINAHYPIYLQMGYLLEKHKVFLA